MKVRGAEKSEALVRSDALVRSEAPVLCEKSTEQCCALLLPDTGVDLDPMIEAALAEDIEYRTGSSRFFVPGPKHHPGNAGQHDCSGAHGTWFKRHHQGAIFQPPTVIHSAVQRPQRAKPRRCFPDGHHLCMRSRIAESLTLVAAGTQNRPVRSDDDGADRHVLRSQCQPGLSQGKAHPLSMAGLRGSHGSMIVSMVSSLVSRENGEAS